jgi:enoyl-CoA hydratase/carnithine racemase
MTTTTVDVRDAAGVRYLTFDRPESLNAVNFDLLTEATAELSRAAEDDQVRCVALTGRGRAFTAGLDLNDDAHTVDERDAAYARFIEVLESFPKPLVAGVNGAAVGLGTTMLGHCDIVLAATSARFRVPFARLGLAPEAGSTVRLPALLGEQAAAYALLTGDWISAEEAERQGLVFRLVAGDDLDAELSAVCEAIAANPVDSLVTTKRLLLDARLPLSLAARKREEPEFARLSRGPDHAEALAAFRERRAPEFRRPAQTA